MSHGFRWGLRYAPPDWLCNWTGTLSAKCGRRGSRSFRLYGSPTEQIDIVIARYEGLIFRHATRIVNIVEIELDDIRAIYRIKTWYALERFDGRSGRACLRSNGACRCARCRFVFMCLKNMEKDLLKRVRRREILLEDAAPSSQPQSRDRFEQRYGLAVSHDEVYGAVEDDLLLPSTLSRGERAVVLALVDGATQADIRRAAGMSRGEMDRVMMGIRRKDG